MKILIGCEESQAVWIAFREQGHEAYSCDLKPCSGWHPEWHLQMDVFNAIDCGMLFTQSGNMAEIDKWDFGIFFPDCTRYKDQPERESGVLVGQERCEARCLAIGFALKLFYCQIEKVAIENPIGVLSSVFRKPDQVLQPWMFGHGETKATCLWLKNLPKLKSTNIVDGREQKMHLLPPTDNRAELRSKTYSGIAKAMAEQWG